MLRRDDEGGPMVRCLMGLLGTVALGALLPHALAVRPAAAEAPRFDLPAACEIGRDCFVQNYVDEDPGPGRLDYACGRLSYDGHKGTDIRLPDYRAMERGVPVLAAADGTVRAVRDGMDDVNIKAIGRDALKGRDAGNSVAVMHGDGWETQYGHMKRGSVAVKPGDRVKAGQRIGLVGLSGNTEFPHVHFEVRLNGRTVDPFLGPDGHPACDAGSGASPPGTLGGASPPGTPAAGGMWRRPDALPYIGTALLSTGMAAERPDPEKARQGAYELAALPGDAPLLVVWSDMMGAMAGDRWRVRLLADGGAQHGRVLFEHEQAQDASKVSQFTFAGLRRPKDGWPRGGGLRSVVTVTRGDRVVAEAERRLSLR